MIHSREWRKIAMAFVTVQCAAEVILLFRAIQSKMIPARYLLSFACVLVLLLLVTGKILFARTGLKPSKGRRVQRIIGCMLSVLLIVGCAAGSFAVAEVKSLVDKVTETDSKLSAMVGVYVLADDPAQELSDASAYTFGIMSDYDQENTQKAVKIIRSELQKEITTVSRPSIVENVQALYDGKIRAVLVNEAYTQVIEDLEEYSDFSDRTRLLFEIPIENTGNAGGEEKTDASDGSDAAAAGTEKRQNRKTGPVLNAVSVTTDLFIVYISGSDTRSELLDRSRSDVNILMAVNPVSRQVLLVNTPRDYYVENPAGDWAMDKLTHCGIYGIDCSVGALEQLYDIDVNYYAQINFTGFETLIDEIGGIDVESDVAFTAGSADIRKGINHLNGEQALAFARERYALAGGDNDRGRNQMKVIAAVIDKMTSGDSSVLLNYSDILSSLEGMFVTSLSSDEIASLVRMQLDEMPSWDVFSYAAVGTGSSEETYSMPGMDLYVMLKDKRSVNKVTELIGKMSRNTVIQNKDLEIK